MLLSSSEEVYYEYTIKMPDVSLLDGSSTTPAGGVLRTSVAAGWSVFSTTCQNHSFTDHDEERYRYQPTHHCSDRRRSRSLRDSVAWIASSKRSDLRGTGTKVVL
jgi:hypothetical protein